MNDPDAAVMRVLYDEHAAALWRYAVRLTGDRARAEDVVQETLLRAWQHPEVGVDPSGRRGRGCSPSPAT
jgi:RNA polymerase sigma-70 factor, ECF subfamily